MKFLKSPKLRKYVKIPLFILISLLAGGYLLILGYSYFFEQDKIAIDRYNFAQLEKIKSVLDNRDKNSHKFNLRNLVDFNEKYNQNIRPMADCYYISTFNGNYPYIVGFKLQSSIFKSIHGSSQYVYPKYDVPVSQICDGRCYDTAKEEFENTINNPCEGSISGYVYEDKNKDGKKDPGESGVEGIGIDFDNISIFTDKTGFYSFNVSPSEWGHWISIGQMKRRIYELSPKNGGWGYHITVKGREDIRNVNFGVEVY